MNRCPASGCRSQRSSISLRSSAPRARLAAPFLPRLDQQRGGWLTFLILATSAAVAQLFLVRTGKNQSYQTSIVFLIPAALLLPPELVALVPVVQHMPDWLKNRTAWYIQIFNISNFTLAILAAYGGAHLVFRLALLEGHEHLQFALGGLTACVLLVGINHSLLAPMLALARGHSLRESGLFSFQSLSTDLVLAALGVGIATFWDSNPWLVPFAVAPLAPDSPIACGPQARGGGPRRPQDRPFQCPPFRPGAERGIDARGPLRPADVADHGRPRSPPRDQQHLRTPCRRRGPEGDRRGLPGTPAPLRRPGAVRRRGVQHPAPGDEPRGGARDRRTDPPRRRAADVRRRDVERAHSRHRLHRRRVLPAGRRPGQRAHPPGRPRRVPREAPGPKPRPRRHHVRAARDPGASGAPACRL